MKQILILLLILISQTSSFSQDTNAYFRHDFYYYQGYNKTFTQDLNSVPSTSNEFVRRAIARYIIEEGADALNDLNKAIEIDPSNANAYFHRGYIRLNYYSYYKQYDHSEFSREKALIDFSKAINIDSSHALAYSFRGKIFGDMKKFKPAFSDIEKALALTTSEPQIFCHMAETKQLQKKYREAILWYERTLKTDSTYRDAYFGLDICNLRLKNYSQSIMALDKLLGLYPELFRVYAMRAYRKIKIGDYVGACSDNEIYRKIEFEQSGRTNDSFSKKYCSKINNNQNDNVNKRNYLTHKCDTLIILQNSDNCAGGGYFSDTLNPTTSYLCHYFHWPYRINQFIVEHKDEIKVIVIENPSNLLPSLKFKELSKLEGIFLFGNDYNCDAIKTVPLELLTTSTLERINFDGVRFPTLELEKLKVAFPKIQFTGTISEYMKEWDQSLKR